jgi:hypothetical protein
VGGACRTDNGYGASMGGTLTYQQEIKPSMIEALKAKQTLKAAELQDGDIVCFQRVHERKSRLGLGDNKSSEEA